MDKTVQEIKQIFSLAYDNHLKGNLELAENLYKKILKLKPQHFETTFLLGTLYLQTPNFDKAKKLLKKALVIKPNHANALHNLGFAFMETRDPMQAKEILNQVLEIEPNHIDANYNLGNIYRLLGDSKMSEVYFRNTIKIQPRHSAAHNNLGNTLKDLGKFEDAINAYNKAIEIQLNHPNAYHNLGNTYKQLGDFKKAADSYKKSFKLHPNNLETLFSLHELDAIILDNSFKNTISKTLKIKKLSEKNIAYGNYLLSIYECREQNYEKEFNYLLKGHLHYFKFKKTLFEKRVEYWLKTVPENEELMILGKSNTNFEKIKPIFIVGVPRCGSTLIEKIIASGNKNIPIGEETGSIPSCLGEKISNKKSIIMDIESLKENIIKKYNDKGLIQEKYDYVFTDKTLDNFFFIGLIKEIFPKAKIINCKRNITSSITSIIKNNLGDVAWAHNPENIFKFFDLYLKKIERFKKLYPNFIYEIQLEELVKNPESESKKLMQFCELPWDKKCLEFYKRKDIISRTASNIQIRKAIYSEQKNKNLMYKQFLNKYGNQYSWYS